MTSCCEIAFDGMLIEKAWHILMQGSRCIVCGEPIFLDVPKLSYGGPSWEHKIPASKGGGNGRTNAAISHRECNHQRRDRLSLRGVRPEAYPAEFKGPPGRNPVVVAPNVWWSHFRLPLGDRR